MRYNVGMKKQDLIDYLGGTPSEAAKRLGYSGYRADNNITRLPVKLTPKQCDVIIMRMKANKIRLPQELANKLAESVRI